MKNPNILRNYPRLFLFLGTFFAFIQLQAADYTLSFDDGEDDPVVAPGITITPAAKSFKVINAHHHFDNVIRHFHWSATGMNGMDYDFQPGDSESDIREFVCYFRMRKCSPVVVSCTIYDEDNQDPAHIMHFNSEYRWNVTVNANGDITPTSAWQTVSSSHGENLGKTYRVAVSLGYVYTFKTGCGNGATSDYDTELIIESSGCGQLAKDNSGCGSNGSIVSYTSFSSGSIYVTVSGKYHYWPDGNPGGSFTMAYQRELCEPDAVVVSGGGTFCGRATLTASGGSGGTIYFQGNTSNGISISDPATSKVVTETGKYYFRARSEGGCWGTQGSAYVVINPLPATTTVSGGGTYCGSATLTASGGAGGGIYYQGPNEDGTSTTQPVTSRTVTSSGTWYFRSRSSEGCWGKPGSATVVINPLPAATTVSGGGTHCGSATLTASGGTGGTIYWQARNSNSTLTDKPETSHTVTSSGTYYFRAGSAEGCWGTQGSATVTIDNPGAVTVSGGGSYCGTTTLTASGGLGGTVYFQGTVSDGTNTSKPGTTASVSISGTYYFRARSATGCWGDQGSATVTIGIPEATTVSGGGAACSSITLTASGGSGGTIYYQGTTSGGTSTAEPVTSNTVSASGTYYFRARNEAGCWGNQGSATVTITGGPGATTVSGGGTSCSSLTLTASGGSGGTIYYQGTTSEGTSTAEPATSKTISASGTYYFRARSSEGCWGEQGSATATIPGIPEATTESGGGTYCSSASLTASGGSGGTIYYQGTTSGGTSTAEPASSKTVSASGTYYFRAKNSGDCWGEQGSTTVTINPVPATTTVTGEGTYCGSATLTVSGSSDGTIYFQGTTSDGTSEAEPVTSKAVTASGTYYFRAANSGCWGPQGNATVTINPVPEATTVSGEGSFCSSTTLTASGGSGGTIYYQGTTGNGTSTAEPATSKTISASGTYYFRALSPEGCWGQEDDAAMTISSGFTADISIQVSPGNIIDQGTEMTFTATNINSIPSPSYQWKINGNDAGSNTNELKISVLQNGDQVSCLLSSDALCVIGSPAVSNTILMIVNLPNALEEISWVNSIVVYPNPSNGEFVIEMKIPQPENIKLRLLNVTGQVIHAEDLKTIAGDYSNIFSINGLVPGVYTLQLCSGSASVCRRILIE
jgi:hypothetical protein